MKVELSRLAEQDIEEIYDYSIRQFGLKQARTYIAGFKTAFDCLADNPRIGVSVYGMKRFPCGRHVIFYQARQEAIFIVRVLH